MAAWKWKLGRRGKPDSRDDCSIPAEFLCQISGRPMYDPVIISSGQSFDRSSVLACKSLGVAPVQGDGVPLDLSSFFPNTNLKRAILSYYERRNVPPPDPLEFHTACDIVSALVTAPKDGACRLVKSDNYVGVVESTILDSLGSFADSPCSSNRCLSDFESLSSEHDRILAKLRSADICDVEEASVHFRNISHSDRDCRVALCTYKMLVALRSLIISSHQQVQVNSLATLVNLSLEKVNKPKIARSGILPNLIDLLKGSGSDEAREHACAALFSLSIEDDNKAAIGALGGLPPLLQALRSNNRPTRVDSAAALYHLSLVRGNRIKLLKIGAVQILLSMTHLANSSNTNHIEHQHCHYRHMILLVLFNLGQDREGRVTMLDAGVVGHMIGLLRGADMISEVERVAILDVLFQLNSDGQRFRWLVKAAGGGEVLHEIATGSKDGNQKAVKILELIARRKEEEDHVEEDVDWEKLLLD
ncbi:hypothetical protein MLD38_034118 [Melastoma candidum]|uniref:Uncharacterized protein n=1 Tax=Melastoma candidum TaxID=119954 RepID=A0ACB9M9G1_9MYRT|nr:hypothetical protein MLD38_034118 [Melastoma candidum]